MNLLTAKPAIDFYFDFSSPYSYIASEWVEAVAARHGRAVQWHAILLGVTFQAAELRSPVSHPIKREYSIRDFGRSASFAGLRAYFTRGTDLSDVATLSTVVTASGLDAPAALAAYTDPLWKERLKRENDAAIASGVFGAPFFIVDGEPFWGNDRRGQIEQWLAGQADFAHTVM